MSSSRGNSKKTLVGKLGIKQGFRIIIFNPPADYHDILGKLPKNVFQRESLDGSLDFIHFFAKKREELEMVFPALKKGLSKKGMLWISWPKAASKMETNLNENIVREIGLNNKMVDVKVCSIDANWSGLKFIYRLQDRK